MGEMYLEQSELNGKGLCELRRQMYKATTQNAKQEEIQHYSNLQKETLGLEPTQKVLRDDPTSAPKSHAQTSQESKSYFRGMNQPRARQADGSGGSHDDHPEGLYLSMVTAPMQLWRLLWKIIGRVARSSDFSR